MVCGKERGAGGNLVPHAIAVPLQDWVRLLWALSTLQARPPADWLAHALEGVQRSLAATARSSAATQHLLSPSSLATLLGALTQLSAASSQQPQVLPPAPLLLHHITARLPDFSPSQLPHVCVCLSQLGWLGHGGGVAPEAVTAELLPRLQATVGLGDGAVAGSRCRGFAAVQLSQLWHLSGVLGPAFSQQLMAAQASCAAGLMRQLQQSLQGTVHIPTLRPGPATDAAATGLFTGLFSRSGHVTGTGRTSYRPQATQLAALAASMAQLPAHRQPSGQHPPLQWHSTVAAAVSMVAQHAQLLAPQQVLMLLVALSKAGLRPAAHDVGAMLASLAPHLPHLTLQEHSYLFVAVARLGFRPHEGWMAHAVAAAAGAVAVRATRAGDAANMLWALARLRVCTPRCGPYFSRYVCIIDGGPRWLLASRKGTHHRPCCDD